MVASDKVFIRPCRPRYHSVFFDLGIPHRYVGKCFLAYHVFWRFSI